jgi:hypothetical protein
MFASKVLSQLDRSLVDFSRWFRIAAVVNGLLALWVTLLAVDPVVPDLPGVKFAPAKIVAGATTQRST